MIITKDMSRRAYELAKAVYQGSADRTSAIKELHTDTGMNAMSAADYIHNLRKMLAGEVYHRTLNFYATNYFLENIRSDFGEVALRNALSALKKHLDYYDSLGRSRQVKLRNLLQIQLASIQLHSTHLENV